MRLCSSSEPSEWVLERRGAVFLRRIAGIVERGCDGEGWNVSCGGVRRGSEWQLVVYWQCAESAVEAVEGVEEEEPLAARSHG